MTRHKHAGLTKELYQRLVSEHAALKQAHAKDYKQFFQDVRQCSEVQARNIYQKFNSVVVGRLKLSPKTAKELEGIISDELFSDIQSYLSKHYTRGTITRYSEVDRITLEYRTKGDLGRNKASVKCALYTAYALGV